MIGGPSGIALIANLTYIDKTLYDPVILEEDYEA